jgi:3-hydroxyisobutyrate dehydrogenase-like beta-hydroxyacid dehydrogenase
MMATGFIGLGDMGAPIAHRLLDGCIELVVFDVRAEAARSLAERVATVATDPAELARQCVANAGTGRSWVTETWGLIDGMFIDHPQAGTDGIYDMMVKEMRNAVVLSKTAHMAVPLTSLGVQVSRGMLERRAVDIEAAVT